MQNDISEIGILEAELVCKRSLLDNMIESDIWHLDVATSKLYA